MSWCRVPLASEVQRSSAKIVKKWGKSKSGVKEEAQESEKFFGRKFVPMPRAKSITVLSRTSISRVRSCSTTIGVVL